MSNLLWRGANVSLSKGANANLHDRAGDTPLHYAAISRNTGFITLLAAGGALVDGPNREGRPPLMVAADRCHYWSVGALLEARADARGVAAPDWPAGMASRKGARYPDCRRTQEMLAAAATPSPQQ